MLSREVGFLGYLLIYFQLHLHAYSYLNGMEWNDTKQPYKPAERDLCVTALLYDIKSKACI